MPGTVSRWRWAHGSDMAVGVPIGERSARAEVAVTLQLWPARAVAGSTTVIGVSAAAARASSSTRPSALGRLRPSLPALASRWAGAT